MKRLFLIILLLPMIFFAQARGISKEGRVIPKIDKIPPIIKIIEPVIEEGERITVKENTIAVKVQAEDENPIQKVLVNGIKASLLVNKTDYHAIIKLNEGWNTIAIEASDINGNTTEIGFIIDYQTDLAGPIVKIIEPPVTRGMKIVQKTDSIMVKGIAVDNNGIYEVTVNNNKAEVTGIGEFSTRINLQMGDNKIIIRALDKKFNSTTDTFTIAREIEEIITPGKYIALVIGIDTYKGIWQPLRNAVNDARAMKEMLYNNYRFDEVISLYNEEATRINIIKKIEHITSHLTPNDNLLIFYSGHGELNKQFNKGYWVPADATSSSTAEYISNSDIQNYINGIPAKHTLLISDACFSGDIFRGGKTESLPFENTDRYYKEVYRRTSRAALTSGGLEPVTDGGRDGHSAFTYYLLKALKNNGSKYLTTGQVFNEIAIAVSNNSGQTPVYQPIKNTGDEGGEFVFVRK